MKKNVNIKAKAKLNPTKIATGIIKQSNLVIFIVLVSAGLVFVVTSLTNIFLPIGTNTTTQTTISTPSASNSNSVTFDQATIDKLNSLKTASDNSGEQTLPTGRINPFSG